jgi:phosphoglycerate dehydrogenase-like enzyme
MKILIAGFYDADLLNRIHRIARASPDQHIETKFALARSDQLKEVEDTEILVPTFDRELFLKAKKLKWVHVFKGGVNSYLFPEFLESEVVLTFSQRNYRHSHGGTWLRTTPRFDSWRRFSRALS